MKRILFIILLIIPAFLNAQTGVGWAQQRAKVNFKDSVNLANGLMIGGVVQTPANWNTAYSGRLQWDGGSTNLVASDGRTSLGATTVGSAFFMLANPSAIRVPIIQTNNTVTATATTGTGNVVLSASPTLSGTVALGTGSLTMTGSLAATGSRVLKGWFTDLEVTNLPTVNGGTLKTALSLTSTDVGLGNVTNESKATMFTSPAFTGSVPTSGGIPLGRATSITGTFTAGALTDITLTGVTTKPYGIMIQTTGGKDITSAVSDSLGISGGIYHLYVYSVDLITDAEIKVTH